MCWCDPNLRTPWCGKPGCQRPTPDISAAEPSYVTLEDYIKGEYADRKIDFTFRAHVDIDGRVTIYTHPLNHSGRTTPTLLRQGQPGGTAMIKYTAKHLVLAYLLGAFTVMAGYRWYSLEHAAAMSELRLSYIEGFLERATGGRR